MGWTLVMDKNAELGRYAGPEVGMIRICSRQETEFNRCGIPFTFYIMEYDGSATHYGNDIRSLTPE